VKGDDATLTRKVIIGNNGFRLNQRLLLDYSLFYYLKNFFRVRFGNEGKYPAIFRTQAVLMGMLNLPR